MSFHMPETIAVSLLERLGHDDAFRDAFAADPRAALADLGFAPAADPTIKAGLWRCLGVESLASKETIRASHVTILAQLTAERAAHSPIALEGAVRKQVA